MNIRTVNASRGWYWLVSGMMIFRKSPGHWLLMMAVLYIASRLIVALPFVGLIAVLVAPNILAGLTHGAHALASGKPLRFGYLASGFLKNPGPLVTVGGVSLIGHLIMLMVIAAMAGTAMSGIATTMSTGAVTPDTVTAMRAAAPRLLMSVIFGLIVSLPIILAVWFAPLLVFFDNMRPVAAMLLSLRACIKNVLAMLVYGLAVLLPLMVMMQLATALTRQPEIGIWLLAPILVSSLFVSYQDLFAPDATA